MYYSNYSDDFSKNSYLKVELRNGITGQIYSYKYNWGNGWDDNYGSLCALPTLPKLRTTLPAPNARYDVFEDCYYYNAW